MQRILLSALLTLLSAALLWRAATLTASFSAPTAITGSAEIIIQPADQLAEIGDLVTVTVQANNVTDPLNGFEFDITFDETIVQLNGIVSADFIAANSRDVVCPPQDNVANGHARFACASSGAGAGATGSGTLAVITFQAIANGTSDLAFTSVKLADTQQPPAAYDITTANGQIKVGGDDPIDSFDIFIPILYMEE